MVEGDTPRRSHLALVHNRPPTTITTYTIHARSFLRWLDTQRDGLSPLDATSDDIKAFLLAETARGISPVTRGTKTIALRAFYSYLVADHHRPDNPATDVDVKLVKARREDVYTKAEADTILTWAANQTSLRWRAGHTVLATFRYTGLRLDELVHLRQDNVDLAAKKLSVVGKGSKHRVIPIPPALSPVLTAYLRDLRPVLPASPYVFVNPQSAADGPHGGCYQPRTIDTLTKAAGRGAGVTGKHFPHKWRHTYATSLLRRGVDIHKVQRLMGHSSVSTTERYMHLVIDDLADAVNHAFPEAPTPPPMDAGRLRVVQGGDASA